MVTEHFLAVRKRKFDDFIIEWLHGSFPLDEAGILITARAYKIHVAVFFNDSYWSTCADRDLNKCKVFLVYRGSLVFEDTRRMTTKEYQDHRPILRRLARYYDTVEKEKVLDSIKRQADLAKKLQKEREARAVKNCIPSDEDSDENENIMPQETGQDKEPASSSKEQPYEDEQNIMPDARDKDQEVDLEEMMDAEHSQDPSASSSEETDSESSSSTSTSYICSTPVCGQVFQMATALKKHERKHTVTHSKDGRIHCDFQAVSTIMAQKELYKDIKKMPMRILENVSNVENNVQMEMLVKSHIQHSSS